MRIKSTAFADNGEIPTVHTCEGRDVAPPLQFGSAPAGANSLALIVDDPDAPDPVAPKMTWVHWVVYDIPRSAAGLPEGGALPCGARDGLNDWKRIGYGVEVLVLEGTWSLLPEGSDVRVYLTNITSRRASTAKSAAATR